MADRLRLGVNIDHVATIRNARGGEHPDPVRAAEIVARVGGDVGGSHRIGMGPAARVPDRRDVIDVDAEAELARHAAARLPGLTAGMAASSGGTASAS